MASTRKAKTKKSVEATTHPADKRLNIPTAELEAFAAESEEKPSELLYPRDPSLDPQLVWNGKDEQDRQDLAVPVVPVYIQETIEPRALIEDLRSESRQRDEEATPTLFADPFEQLSLEQRVDFYRHPGDWTNRMILGDSLLVMASLAEKEGLRGQVQMIYMDPPYGIKFGSNWQVSTRKRDVKDGKVEDATRQPEQIRAFRDTWELGIHSYLSYLRDRLVVARDLLTESGSIFVQIGDENIHLVRSLMDEVFGSTNAVLTIVFKKKGATTATDPVNDYVLWYAKKREQLRARRTFLERSEPEDDPKFNTLIGPKGEHKRVKDLSQAEITQLIGAGYEWARVNYPIVSQHPSAERSKDFVWNGKTYSCGRNNQWRFGETGLRRLAAASRLFDGGGKSLAGVVYWKDWPRVARSNLWTDLHGEQDSIYVVQTNRKVVERCIVMTTDPGDLVLDPTCGSGTAAYVAEQWGRRWITIDTSRVALALSRTRLMTGRYPYYLLADSSEGRIKEAELSGQPPPQDSAQADGDVKKGFVYERVPHVTLKSIANNSEIKEDMTREEIDAVIARHAEMEILYDRPYVDPKIVRVTGPFTVESLSPHRLAPPVEDETAVDRHPTGDASRFVERVLDNLRVSGVENTVQSERLTFDLLEPWTGNGYIQGRGEYTERGRSRVAAICIGPENGTVGKELVEAAAKEAVSWADLLVVCGFAFDAYAQSAHALGRLKILQAKVNPDLQMPDLLKKTGAGNLFVVFGEPDVDVRTESEGMVTVEIRGVDVYDPTTGAIRSHSTDDIACWFIDTDYDQESFFVRHVYFSGADDPYERLRKTLRAEINEAAWSSIYSTSSRPFPKPSTGRIAVKIVNHYGDEVLKIYRVSE